VREIDRMRKREEDRAVREFIEYVGDEGVIREVYRYVVSGIETRYSGSMNKRLRGVREKLKEFGVSNIPFKQYRVDNDLRGGAL